MNAVVADMYPLIDERVTHVAFRCGCVRTLRAGDAMLANCPQHQELMISFTEESLADPVELKAPRPWLDPH